MILQKFELIEDNPQYSLKIKETLTLKPDGFYVRAKPRKAPAPHVPSTIPPPSTHASAPVAHPAEVAHQAEAAHKGGEVTHQVTKGKSNGLLVLYGSNSGSSEAFAQRLHADAIVRGYDSHLETLDTHSG